MSMKSQAAKDAAAAKMKLANTKSVVVLPKLPPQPGRNAGGRFTAGNQWGVNNYGRSKHEFTCLARKYVEDGQVLKEVNDMATARGRFSKIDAATQLKAADVIMSRAYGSANTCIELDVDTHEGHVTKRLIGVPYDAL
jgi:hypothetical protein